MKKILLGLLIYWSISLSISANSPINFLDTYQHAMRGNIDAQYNLALLYKQGKLVDQDLVLSLYWFLKAAVARHEICDTITRNLRHYNCRRFSGSRTILNVV